MEKFETYQVTMTRVQRVPNTDEARTLVFEAGVNKLPQGIIKKIIFSVNGALTLLEVNTENNISDNLKQIFTVLIAPGYVYSGSNNMIYINRAINQLKVIFTICGYSSTPLTDILSPYLINENGAIRLNDTARPIEVQMTVFYT